MPPSPHPLSAHLAAQVCQLCRHGVTVDYGLVANMACTVCVPASAGVCVGGGAGEFVCGAHSLRTCRWGGGEGEGAERG